jgi:hypothetical protein
MRIYLAQNWNTVYIQLWREREIRVLTNFAYLLTINRRLLENILGHLVVRTQTGI